MGNKFGNRFGTKAERSGGIILIILGIKIVLEHLKIHKNSNIKERLEILLEKRYNMLELGNIIIFP